MQEFPQKATKNSEVSVSAPDTWGSLKFSIWQYSTNGTTWKDLSAYLNVSFIISCIMKVRALYVNPTTNLEVSLSATIHAVKDDASGYDFDGILKAFKDTTIYVHCKGGITLFYPEHYEHDDE